MLSQEYLVKHECNHQRPDNTRIGVDAQINSNENGMEDDTRLQHDSSHSVLCMLGCKQLLLGFSTRWETWICDFYVCGLSMGMTIYWLSVQSKASVADSNYY